MTNFQLLKKGIKKVGTNFFFFLGVWNHRDCGTGGFVCRLDYDEFDNLLPVIIDP